MYLCYCLQLILLKHLFDNNLKSQLFIKQTIRTKKHIRIGKFGMFVFVCTALKACSFPSESQPNTNENKLYVQPNSNNKNLVFNLVYTNTDF